MWMENFETVFVLVCAKFNWIQSVKSLTTNFNWWIDWRGWTTKTQTISISFERLSLDWSLMSVCHVVHLVDWLDWHCRAMDKDVRRRAHSHTAMLQKRKPEKSNWESLNLRLTLIYARCTPMQSPKATLKQFLPTEQKKMSKNEIRKLNQRRSTFIYFDCDTRSLGP